MFVKCMDTLLIRIVWYIIERKYLKQNHSIEGPLFCILHVIEIKEVKTGKN